MVKNAELWKRIMRDGIETNGKDFFGNTASQISLAHIIVDSRSHEATEWASPYGKKIAIPFENLFIETSATADSENGDNLKSRFGIYAQFRQADNGDGWFARVGCIQQIGNTRPDMLVVFTFLIDKEGTIPNRPPMVTGNPGVDVNHAMEVARLGFYFLSDTLELLSCKNVDVSPRDVIERSSNAAKRHGGEPNPAFRYHVLVVRPAGARSNHPGQEIGTMPRHICRGHFKEYTPEKPLFGISGMHGRFFIPPHMRGDKKNGVVEKDYEVRMPA